MSQSKVTKEQIVATLNTIRAVADCIKELGEVPSGVLYARVMEFVSFDLYNKIIDTLKGAGVVTESNHLLKWKEPKERKPCDHAKIRDGRIMQNERY